MKEEESTFRTVIKTPDQLRNEFDPQTVQRRQELQAENDSIPKDPLAIWDPSEVPAEEDLLATEDYTDDRITPEFEIMYKQDLSSTDLYMNMGFKDSSSACCDCIVVRITLPNTRYKDVTLDVTPTALKASTSRYKLLLNLPHEVNEEKGKAQWLSKDGVLKITLPIVDELRDFY